MICCNINLFTSFKFIVCVIGSTSFSSFLITYIYRILFTDFINDGPGSLFKFSAGLLLTVGQVALSLWYFLPKIQLKYNYTKHIKLIFLNAGYTLLLGFFHLAILSQSNIKDSISQYKEQVQWIFILQMMFLISFAIFKDVNSKHLLESYISVDKLSKCDKVTVTCTCSSKSTNCSKCPCSICLNTLDQKPEGREVENIYISIPDGDLEDEGLEGNNTFEKEIDIDEPGRILSIDANKTVSNKTLTIGFAYIKNIMAINNNTNLPIIVFTPFAIKRGVFVPINKYTTNKILNIISPLLKFII